MTQKIRIKLKSYDQFYISTGSELVMVAVHVSRILRQNAQYDEALSLLDDIHDLVSAGGALETYEGACLLEELGSLHKYTRNFKKPGVQKKPHHRFTRVQKSFLEARASLDL